LIENPNFWDGIAYLLSQYPNLAEQGIAGYGNLYPNTTFDNLTVSGFQGVYLIPALSPSNTSESLTAAIVSVFEQINVTWPNNFQYTVNASTYASFYDWWNLSSGPYYAGIDLLVGSRLLDAESLTANLTALKTAIQVATPPGQSSMVDFISGKGVWNVVPRGGSDAVLPAWRKTLVHFTNGVGWDPFNKQEQAEQTALLTNTYVEALRVLAPNTGAYLNEADKYEPNPQTTFWGSNYPRLLDIKRKYDPNDVLWCTPCVGNERWAEDGDLLCRV